MKTDNRSTFLKKIFLFLGLVLSIFIGVTAAYLTGSIYQNYGYTGHYEFIKNSLEPLAEDDYRRVYSYFENNMTTEYREYIKHTNANIIIYRLGQVKLGDYKGNDEGFHYVFYPRENDEANRVEVIISTELPIKDNYYKVYNFSEFLFRWRYVFPVIMLMGAAFAVVLCIILCWSAGERDDEGKIKPTVFDYIPLEVILAVLLAVEVMGGLIFERLLDSFEGEFLSGLVKITYITLQAMWVLLVGLEITVRIKAKTLMDNMWLGQLIRLIGRGIRFVAVYSCKGFRHLSLTWRGFVIFMLFALTDLFFFFNCTYETFFVLWVIEKLILLPFIFYLSYSLKKMAEGAKALAAGDMEYKTDTKYMFLSMKDTADNLNNISAGMASAVNRTIKSERFKTELITNVSHDIKTPVTSIINYANLIQVEVSHAEGNTLQDVARVGEYADVLERQSKRLKKLLEDLVEASKADSGAVDVTLAPCNVSVLLSQATSEYEDRLNAKGLIVITKQPDDESLIQADGRHLWRVFDNLLSNICKYAREDSRVYITVEPTEGNKTSIIFRNMSKYALELNGDDLTERFVRGDRSRHMEGSGLGLSIAESLTELQHGTMEIVTDGDLFKVILTFMNYKE